MARFTQWPPDDLPEEDSTLYGRFLFGDGSQRLLAAMTVWVAILLCWRRQPDALEMASVKNMIYSFLEIPTTVRASEIHGSALESVISRIVSQNINAKVQPITSFGWCSILKSVVTGNDSSTFEEALNCYNSHPEVVAHDRQETGSGTISLDSRKRQAVRNWMDRTCQAAYEEVASSTHDYPYNLGREGFAGTALCFLQSKANFEVNLTSDETDHPLPGEPFCTAAWLHFTG